MFYRKFKNTNIISDFCSKQVTKDFLETSEDIVLSWDNHYYLKSECPKKPKELVIKDQTFLAKAKRNQLLKETDYLFREDYPIDPTCKEQFKIYCQALRDLPLQKDFPTKITWPDKPKIILKISPYSPKDLYTSRENTYEL